MHGEWFTLGLLLTDEDAEVILGCGRALFSAYGQVGILIHQGMTLPHPSGPCLRRGVSYCGRVEQLPERNWAWEQMGAGERYPRLLPLTSGLFRTAE